MRGANGEVDLAEPFVVGCAWDEMSLKVARTGWRVTGILTAMLYLPLEEVWPMEGL